jgi:DNA-binding transcriptional LysR family regulator
VRARDLDGAPFVFPDAGVSPEGHAGLLEACRTAGFEPDVRHEAADLGLVLGLVSAGLGLGIVQRSATRPAGVRGAPLPRRFPLRLELHAVTARDASPLARQLVDTCPLA